VQWGAALEGSVVGHLREGRAGPPLHAKTASL